MSKPMTMKEAAEYLGFELNTFRKAKARGRLKGLPFPKCVKIGDRFYHYISDLDEWEAMSRGESIKAAPTVDIAELPHYIHELIMVVKRNPSASFTITGNELTVKYKGVIYEE